MGKFFDHIPSFAMAQIRKQHMFWVATAPLEADGHINLSPKGLEDTFHIIDEHTVWYEDLTGSGNETISHLRENGRITVFFNMFEGPPGIIRLFGKGTVYEFGTPEYNELIPPEKRLASSRSVILVNVHKVGTSCGYQVPLYEFVSHRTKLLNWGYQKETADIDNSGEAPKGLHAYWKEHNEKSMDGLPGLSTALEAKDKFVKRELLVPFNSEDAYIVRGGTKEKGLEVGKAHAKSCTLDKSGVLGFSLGVLATAAYVKILM